MLKLGTIHCRRKKIAQSGCAWSILLLQNPPQLAYVVEVYLGRGVFQQELAVGQSGGMIDGENGVEVAQHAFAVLFRAGDVDQVVQHSYDDRLFRHRLKVTFLGRLAGDVFDYFSASARDINFPSNTSMICGGPPGGSCRTTK